MRLRTRLFIAALLFGAAGMASSQAKAKIAYSNSYTLGGGVQIGYATDTCSSTIYGALSFNSSTNILSAWISSGWTQIATGSGSGATLSGLTAATATNTINNATFAQTWQWNTLAGAAGLTLSSTSTAAASNGQEMLNLALSGANATTSQTTYDAYLTNTHTGTTATNVGLYASASGGTNNYAGIFAAGSVGVGTTTPAAKLDVAGEIRTTGNTLACSATTGGAIRFNSVTSVMEYCNGSAWSFF